MTRHLFCVALCVQLAVPTSAFAAPAPSAAEQARSAVERGQTAYDRGDFDAALGAFERAYTLDPQPMYLYPWAQAARNAGDCDLSRELYSRFLDSGVQGDARLAAEQNMERCEPKPQPEPKPPPPEPAPQRSAPQPPAPAEIEPLDAAQARSRDALGISLLAAGAVTTVAGSAVLAVAAMRASEQRATTDHARFDNLDASIDQLQLVGGITLGVGGALLLGGAIRLGVVHRAQVRPVATTWSRTARGTPIVGIRIGASRAARHLSVR